MRSLAMKGIVCLAAMLLPLLLRAQTMPPLLPGAARPHLDSLNLSSALSDSNEAIAVRADSSAAAVLRGETPEARLLRLRRQAFVEQMLAHASLGVMDSTLAFRLAAYVPVIGLTAEELARLQPQRDPIAEAVRRDQLGVPSLFNLGEALGKGVKYLANKTGLARSQPNLWTAIPSAAEVSVMKVLWQEGKATPAAIYARVDSLALTVKDLEVLLESLRARGWLTRAQVSPQNEFTAFGIVKFEMSRKNAKNREFLYQPVIHREDMLAYLDASAYSRQVRHAYGDDLVVAHLRQLMTILATEGTAGKN